MVQWQEGIKTDWWMNLPIYDESEASDWESGSTYIIKENTTNFYKIGYSSLSGHIRLSGLQTGNPRELILIANIVTTNPKQLEERIHSLLKEKQVRGEWFKLEIQDIDKLLAFIDVVVSLDTKKETQ